ncbi:hypothetical protein H0E87_028380 [Populus deltoides]|uniref:Uncharacterized protein n=1 Tax=Populus deltoides TaxID=3696 RepID=A0A8T2WSQ2_POPDE|nr:hypothetical protein H0E87_028380 [Populus deltoides]
MAHNIWHNFMFDNLDLRNQFFTVNITIILNSSVPGAARRKMNRPEAKAGGFEALYRAPGRLWQGKCADINDTQSPVRLHGKNVYVFGHASTLCYFMTDIAVKENYRMIGRGHY